MVLMRLPVSSAALLCRAVVRLISWERLNALVGRDVLSEKLVKAEATGLFAEPASSEAESWPFVRGLCGAGLGRIEESAETSWLSFGFDI